MFEQRCIAFSDPRCPLVSMTDSRCSAFSVNVTQGAALRPLLQRKLALNGRLLGKLIWVWGGWPIGFTSAHKDQINTKQKAGGDFHATVMVLTMAVSSVLALL